MHDHIPISETEITVAKMKEIIENQPDDQVIRIALMRDYSETENIIRPIGSMIQADDTHGEAGLVMYVVAYMSTDGYDEFAVSNGIADESHNHPDSSDITDTDNNPFFGL